MPDDGAVVEGRHSTNCAVSVGRDGCVVLTTWRGYPADRQMTTFLDRQAFLDAVSDALGVDITDHNEGSTL
ncbi:hypothetical protein [Salana multivorans]|uniref:hypothetical protein n=1 Tax=Salana multivorans TaxID=120377 RepID=UPI001B8702B3|nr:hypothetical protein [Salana multivorans]